MAQTGINNAEGTPYQVRRYRGVRNRSSESYGAVIRDPDLKKQIWLGAFRTAEEAARVYDAAAKLLRGDKAVTNFSEVSEYHLQKAKEILHKLKAPEDVSENNVSDAPRSPLLNRRPFQFPAKRLLEKLRRGGLLLPTPASIQKETHMELNLELTLAQPGSVCKKKKF